MDVGLVCDACSAFSPMGAFECVRCGAPVSLEPDRARTDVDEPPRTSEPRRTGRGGPKPQPCPTCGVMVTPGHRFCFNCGGKMPAYEFAPEDTKTRSSGPLPKAPRSTMFFGAMQAAKAKLTLIRGDGLDGVSFTLAGEE